jgi:transcriptional regulator with XRE-family HTH domain
VSDALMWQTERARSIRANRQVGAAIRLAREDRGWRLADLAVQVGYSVSTISRLETSRHGPTDLGQIRRLADAVGIPRYALGELLGVPASAGPVTVASRLARLRETYDAGNLARVIGVLPDLPVSADPL